MLKLEVAKVLSRASFKKSFIFYCFQLDNQEQITNIFWVDRKMLIDYEHFGDVVTYDTTYSTNKEYRPLGVFLGFNHHRGTIVFGASLLYDETAASFIWVFETFLEAHKRNARKIIFTDQAPVMAATLVEVMLNTSHGLCNWNIMENVIRHLGNLMKNESCFLSDFKACMYNFEGETEFEK
ncbi:hypothetical protein ACH5RR_013288 [Cinchona calisaya]|uniref:MULE transposase domain-containing protein n=1 Tax=Cinchona calisaya TaxID=153742 RepID=A0ABD2ZZM7_9GENT